MCRSTSEIKNSVASTGERREDIRLGILQNSVFTSSIGAGYDLTDIDFKDTASPLWTLA